MTRWARVVLVVLGTHLVSLPLSAGEKALTVPREGLQIDGAVARTDRKVRVIHPNPKVKPLEVPARTYPLQLSARKVYCLVLTAENEQDLDPFLILRDAGGKVLVYDNDAGGGKNARLLFAPPADGTYTVYAAAFAGQGKFVLTITAEEQAEAKLPARETQILAKLQSQIDAQAEKGELGEALRLARVVLAAREKWQGNLNWQTADARFNVAHWQRLAELPVAQQKQLAPAIRFARQVRADHARNQLAEAEKAIREALAIYRAVLGEKHSETGRAYHRLAAILGDQGRYTEAQQLSQKALEIFRAALGEQHPNTAICYNNMALYLQNQGQYAAAQPLYQKALDIFRAVLGEQHPETAANYGNLAGNLHAQGRYAAAQPLSQKSLDIFRAMLGEQHRYTATGYNNLAASLNGQGRYAAAQPLLQKALDIYRDVLGEKSSSTARAYHNLAVNLATQDQHAAARPLYQKALDIRRALLGEKHPDTASSYIGVASNLEDQDQHAAARPLYQKALDVRRAVLGEKHPDTASSYIHLAHNLDSQGDRAAGRPLHQKALDIRRAVLGEKHPDTARSYYSLALDQLSLGEDAAAEENLRAALLGHDLAWEHRAVSGFERGLGAGLSPRSLLVALLARRGDAVAAWKYAEADLARGLLYDLDDPAGRPDQGSMNQLAVLRNLDERLVPLLTASDLDAGRKQVRDALLRQREELLDDQARRAAQRASGRVLPLDKVRQHLAADAALVLWVRAFPHHWACVLRREGPPRWVPLPGRGPKGGVIREDRDLPLRLHKALASPHQVGEAERMKLTAAFLKERFDPLRKHLQASGQLPAVRRLLVVPTADVARVPLEALTGEYTISYVPSGSVFARRAEQHRPLQPMPLLALGDPVFTPASAPPAPPPADGLLVQLVLPGGSAERAGLRAGDVLLRYHDTPLKKSADLKVVPDGAVVKVVFWRDGKELVARVPPGNLGVSIDERPAAEAVAAWRATQHQLASAQRTGHARLPATRFEVAALRRLVGEKHTTLLLGSEASEQALDGLGKGGLKRFRLLHFATHGDVDQVNPTRSALILAQDLLPDGLDAARQGQKVYNGRLTVETILRDWELDADLVVLSACESGLGKDAGGEGLLGFAQAFLQKGARSVLLSRWKVDDTATALLMVRFYENALGKRKDLKGPLARAAALEESRQWLRQLSRADAEHLAVNLTGGVLRGTERDETPPAKGKVNLPPGDRPFAHPYYWASFVLIGDPD